MGVNFEQIRHELPDNMKWLEQRTILLTRYGSHAYGTNVETSDEDYKGVCVPPVEYFLGLKSINEYNTSGGKNFSNKAGDIDVTIAHINKFVKDAMSGVPNNLDVLFVRESDIIHVDQFGDELRSMRMEFLSKAIKHKFGRYAHSQKHKIAIKSSNGTGRQDLIEQFGYDTKFAMHTARLLSSAIDILRNGTYSTYRPNAPFLLDIRNGKYNEQELMEMLDQYEQELEYAYEASDLRHSPDYAKINKWLIGFNMRVINYYKEKGE